MNQEVRMKTKSILELFKDTDLSSIPSQGLLLDYLESLATIEDDHLQKQLLKELIHRYVILENRVDSLLKNTLPETVAKERYEQVMAVQAGISLKNNQKQIGRTYQTLV